jgi:hypothetical protein
MGACSGFAGAAGGLREAVVRAPLTAPRPAPRFTVHKKSSLQERIAPSAWVTDRLRPPHFAISMSFHDLGHRYWQLIQNAH